eukprot:scaffold752_cov322-Pavlova_lutheri.AAC.28
MDFWSRSATLGELFMLLSSTLVESSSSSKPFASTESGEMANPTILSSGRLDETSTAAVGSSHDIVLRSVRSWVGTSPSSGTSHRSFVGTASRRSSLALRSASWHEREARAVAFALARLTSVGASLTGFVDRARDWLRVHRGPFRSPRRPDVGIRGSIGRWIGGQGRWLGAHERRATFPGRVSTVQTKRGDSWTVGMRFGRALWTDGLARGRVSLPFPPHQGGGRREDLGARSRTGHRFERTNAPLLEEVTGLNFRSKGGIGCWSRGWIGLGRVSRKALVDLGESVGGCEGRSRDRKRGPESWSLGKAVATAKQPTRNRQTRARAPFVGQKLPLARPT